MMIGDVIRSAVVEFGRRLRERFGDRVLQLTLFGSHARGQARSESDVDIAVVVRNLTGRERTDIYELGADIALDRSVRLAPLAFSDLEAAEMQRLERLLWRDITHEGIPLD